MAWPWERKFLGFGFTANREPKRWIAPKAVLRWKEKARELTRRTRDVSVERMADELSRYLRGWIGYFGKCQTPRGDLRSGPDVGYGRRSGDSGNEGRCDSRKLPKRGVGRDLAALTAGSAHGPWRLAKSPAISFALPNAYFDGLRIPRLTVR